jgi:hypothetical protein
MTSLLIRPQKNIQYIMAIEEQGLREATLRKTRKTLKILAENADLNDAEQVKSFTANLNANESGTQLILPQVIRTSEKDVINDLA